jgi:hypothetical protein
LDLPTDSIKLLVEQRQFANLGKFRSASLAKLPASLAEAGCFGNEEANRRTDSAPPKSCSSTPSGSETPNC